MGFIVQLNHEMSTHGKYDSIEKKMRYEYVANLEDFYFIVEIYALEHVTLLDGPKQNLLKIA